MIPRDSFIFDCLFLAPNMEICHDMSGERDIHAIDCFGTSQKVAPLSLRRIWKYLELADRWRNCLRMPQVAWG